jgi:signal transduction histidine kinase
VIALTLQRRVALWAGTITAVGMVLCCACIALLTHRAEMAELDDQLRSEAAGFFHEWTLHGGPAFDFRKDPEAVREWLSTLESHRLAEVADTRGRVVYRSPSLKDDALHSLPLGLHDLRLGAMSWRYGGFAQDGIILRLTGDVAPVHALLRTIVLAFVIALPVLLAFLAISARWAAHAALEPVRRITSAAENVRADRVDAGVPVPHPADEIQRLAHVINRAFARLRQSYEQAQRFSADASHELKTPLTVLRATVESMLDSDDLSPAQQQNAVSLLEQTRRLVTITESLLLLSRADAGRLRLDYAATNLSELLQACVEDARIMAGAREIEVQAQIPEDLHAKVDGGRLSQIFVNLLDNALKYNEPGGIVSVTVTVEDRALRVNVGNTGTGVSSEHVPLIFERFFRADQNADAPGQGLGLSLARELARAHEGDLLLVSSRGGWTEFSLRIPLAQDEVSDKCEGAPRQPIRAGNLRPASVA